uniref:Bifunctional inhibitor/plant lipid transfer protein/seed storage helical domain-containing protein n=1 Tax=Setaria italica TaxID=4555 RepID=K3XRG5_SETIT
MFTAHQVLGEDDRYPQKDVFVEKCMDAIEIGTDYVNPSQSYIHTVEKYDMECICRVINPTDETKISIMKTLRLAYVCHQPIPMGRKCGTWTISATNIDTSLKALSMANGPVIYEDDEK